MEENLDTQNDEVALPSMEDTISSAWADIQSRGEVERDGQGKFAQKDTQEVAKDEAVEVKAEPHQEQQEEQQDHQEESPQIKPPSSWKAETKAKFSSLPPDVQAEVLKREEDNIRGIKQYKDQAEKASRYEAAFAPYARNFESAGLAPEKAIEGILRTENTLRNGSPAQKVAAVQDIIASYGINPEWFTNTPQVNPEVGHLQNQLQQFEAKQAELMRQMQEQQQQRESVSLNSELSNFAKDHEHFDTVRERMADLLQGGAAKTLQEAYETAIWADANIRTSIIAKQQAEERAKASEKAKQAKTAAKVNVPRRGVIPAQPSVGTMDDTIRAAAKELGMY
jgi:hypothetical protein